MKRRKGFTLVELVIVIAVIVILAAVLIPTFSGVIEKANNAKDFSLVSEMNKVLALEEATDGKNETIYEANLDLKKYGMDIEKLPSSKGYIYAWNSKENRVAALNKDYKLVFPQGEEINDSNKENYFAVARTNGEVESLNAAKYSLYLTEDNTVTTVTINQGIDTGNNKNITTVNYNGNDTAKSVIIRTNSKAITLTIDALNDTVKHYDEVGTVKVIAVDRVASYHEFGNANTLIVNDGHIVVENDAKIDNIIVEKSEVTEAKVSVDNSGEVTTIICSDDSAEITGVSDDKKVTEIKGTLTSGGYVKLSANQTISEQIVIDSDTVLDLNGYTISVLVDKGILVKKGTLTVIDTAGNGKIDAEEYASVVVIAEGGNAAFILNSGEIYRHSTAGATVRVGKNDYGMEVNEYNSTFTMNGGKINGTYGVLIMGQNSKYYMNGGEVVATSGFAVGGNGQVSYGGTYIQINGGKIVTTSQANDACAMYLPQYGTTEINGGYIEGHDGINIKSGTLTVNGGKIVSNGAFDQSIETNNGSVSTGSAITISSSKSYVGNISVKISGGIFESAHGYAIAEIIPELASGDLAAASTCVNFIQFNGGTYVKGDAVNKAIYIEYAYEKISWSGIDSRIIKVNK